MRILSKGGFNLRLEDLGFPRQPVALLSHRRSLTAWSSVSGRTGAGKSTTLYAAMTEIEPARSEGADGRGSDRIPHEGDHAGSGQHGA